MVFKEVFKEVLLERMRAKMGDTKSDTLKKFVSEIFTILHFLVKTARLENDTI